MGLLTRLFGKPEKEIKELTTEPEKTIDPSQPVLTGTTLRTPIEPTRITRKKLFPELTSLEMVENQGWEVKTLPVWKAGDVILDTYEVEDVISGGMGHVYIANHKNWNVKLAIKSPNEMMLSDKDLYARIIREANSWTELGLHPNIAYCYYVRNIEEVPHIFVEYVDGGNLRRWIEEGKCIDYRTSLDLAIQFCHGMEHAHSRGMIHRDIKPENVLMTQDGILKITDFGLVGGGGAESVPIDSDGGRIKQQGEGLTSVGALMGTEGYMAPEQVESARDVDERADIFSFGVCLYEMFCGNKPYDITYGPRQDTPDPISLNGDQDFPDGIAAILQKCIQWDPSNRYHSLKKIRHELVDQYRNLFGEKSRFEELKLVDFEADGMNNRGITYFELGREEEAVSFWEKALKANPTHLEATYNLSLHQWRSGKILDDEVIARLENCGENPATSKSKWAELTACVHAERLDLEAAKNVLRELPGSLCDQVSAEDLSQIVQVRSLEGHTRWVITVAFTPDSRHLLSGGEENTFRMWALDTGHCVQTMKGHDDSIHSIRVSTDGLAAISCSRDKTVRKWELETGRCLWVIEGGAHAVTPDCRFAVVAETRGESVRLYDFETGRHIRTMEGQIAYSNKAIAITSDSSYAVTAMDDTTLRIWDLNSGQCVRTMAGHTDSIESVRISPDGQYAISSGRDTTARLWDLATGRCVRVLEGHSAAVNAIVITPDGTCAVSKSSDKTLRTWNLDTGQCLMTMEGDAAYIEKFVITADSNYAITSKSDGAMRIWDIEAGRCIRSSEGFFQRARALGISPDGNYMVSGGEKRGDDTLKVWRIKTGNHYKSDFAVSLPRGFSEISGRKEKLHDNIRLACSLYEKGDLKGAFALLIDAWRDSDFIDEQDVNRLYNRLARKGRKKRLAFSYQKKTLQGHSGTVHSIAVAPDGQHAVSGSADKTLRLWEIKTGQCTRVMEGHSSSIYSVAISPDGLYAASSSADRTVRCWELSSGRCIHTMEGHFERVYTVAISPDGRYVISGGQDMGLRVWDLATGENVRHMAGDSEIGAFAISFTPDGNSVISGGKNLKEWDFRTGKCIRTIETATSLFRSLSISLDGRYMVSGDWNGTVRLWDLQTGDCRFTMEGHAKRVESVDIISDGLYSISGSMDKTICLWNLETGQSVGTLDGHMDMVHSTAFTPDGLYAVSGGADNTVRVWQFIWELEFD